MKVTNEQLGAVYLEVDGLDKERFKELTKGMDIHPDYSRILLNTDYEYLENWFSLKYGYSWFPTDDIDIESRKITLDELEQLLNTTHFAISPEDYAEFMKWKDSQQPKLKPIEIVGCLMEDCNDVNFDVLNKSIKGYYDYKKVLLSYGDLDVFTAKYDDDGTKEIILFGHWNDGVTE